MMLLIDICKEKLHFYEFVKPVEDILVKNKIKGFTRHYSCLTKKDLEKAEKIIICGTSLKDNQFLKDLNKFQWIKSYDKPILGICGGMQIIQTVFRGKLKKKKEIGLKKIKFKKEFLGFSGERKVYNLHQFYIDSKEFETFDVSDSKIPQAVKYKSKPFYGTLFHPEVRNKEIIVNFCRL